MTTTRKEIEGWLNEGIEKGATHVIIALDRFDWDNYPVYVMSGESARSKADEYNRKNMQGVDEVYDLSLPLDKQLNERRAFHY